jgi:hypothetical protein
VSAAVDAIVQDKELRGVLEYAFDFRILVKPEPQSWFMVRATEEFDSFAEDASGGVFLVGRPSGRILLVTSEGQAGVIARSIEELLELMVSHPFWRDLLKFSGGGQLVEMMRAVPYLQRELGEDEPMLEKHRQLVRRKLKLFGSNSAIERLHANVAQSSPEVSVEAADGTVFTALFNRFTVDANPAWQHPLQHE